MGTGFTSIRLVGAGGPQSLVSAWTGLRIETMADGFIPTMDGTGTLITPGVGLPFITDAGPVMQAMAGYGGRDKPGGQRG